jgi:hypothetical protein
VTPVVTAISTAMGIPTINSTKKQINNVAIIIPLSTY